jgi:hypothetical protein
MSSKDDEQSVLDALENQLRAEDPELMHCFSAFCRVTPAIKPVRGWKRTTPQTTKAQRGRRRLIKRQAYAIVVELVLVTIAVVFIALLMLGAEWLLAALSR